MGKVCGMDEKQIEQTVRHTLITLGFDLSKPTEIQEDVAFLRRFRKLCEGAGTKAVMVIIGVAVLGIIGGVFAALRNSLKL